MKILVTGSEGFVGKNLVAELRNQGYSEILEYNRDTAPDLLVRYAEECDFVFHLAGVNRPKVEKEFFEGNTSFTEKILTLLEKFENTAPVVLSSSIQAELNNPYGKSKFEAEELVFEHCKRTGAPAFIYRLPNLFGKWSKPNYNSVVATFCHNIARGIKITVNDPNAKIDLCYIDDLLAEFLLTLVGNPTREGKYCTVKEIYNVSVGQIANLLENFRESRTNLVLPDFADTFTKKLYSTYLSFLPENDFDYDLTTHADNRGSFTEFLRTPDRGQVSVNISKPGISKGNHWHHTKTEKFLVVSGEGLIRFRKYNEESILEYAVNGEKLQVVDIPPGYTHTIINTGATDLVTIMWVNECFNPEKPDTYFLEVEKP